MKGEVITALFQRYHWDPLAFCVDMFPPEEQPREWQPEVLAAVRLSPWIAIAACRKAGKTRLAAFLVIWFLCTRANSLVITIAPVWSQVVQVLWADIRHLWAVSKLPAIFPSWQVLTQEIQTHPMTPKWRACGLASNDPQNLEGRHPAAGQPTLVVIDESKAVGDLFFDSMQGMLSEGESRLLSIGTPGVPFGFFYRAFAHDRGLWSFQRQISAFDIPRLAGKCEEERQRKGENDPFFRQQWLAEFTGADDGAVIPFADIERAIDRTIDASQPAKLVVSLDIAGSGGDENVLTYRAGARIVKQEGWQGVDEMQTASRAAQAVSQWRASSFVYDEIGIGAGVGSRIRELLRGTPTLVHGFNAGRSARDKEQYANIKAEEVFFLRQRFLEGNISIPRDSNLIGQLCSWRTEFTQTGKTRVVDPGDSPDYADSCLMAFAADRLGQSMRGVTPGFLQ